MQKKRKKNRTGIIIVGAAVVLMVALMIVWQQYESKNKARLKASLLTADVPDTAIVDTGPRAEKEEATIPDDPEEILAIAAEALEDAGYFKPGDLIKGFRVYVLLKKCLDCNGDPDKVAELAMRLKERSAEGYGPWRVESNNLDDLDNRIKKAKQI